MSYFGIIKMGVINSHLEAAHTEQGGEMVVDNSLPLNLFIIAFIMSKTLLPASSFSSFFSRGDLLKVSVEAGCMLADPS
jgi:hypothetical protein